MKKYITIPFLMLFLTTSLIAQDLKKVIIKKADYDNYPQFRYALALLADNRVVQQKIKELQDKRIQLLIFLTPNKIEHEDNNVSGLTDYREADKTITIRLDNSGNEKSYMYFLEMLLHELAHAFEPTSGDKVHQDIAQGKGTYFQMAREGQRSLSQYKQKIPASLIGFYEVEEPKEKISIPENNYNCFTAVINRHIMEYKKSTRSKIEPQFLSYQKYGGSTDPDYNFSPIYFKSGVPPLLKYQYKEGDSRTIEREFFNFNRLKGYDVFIEKANDYLYSLSDESRVQFQKLFKITEI